jgi:general secretion pathway protein K
VTSSFFEVRGQLRLGQTTVQQQSVVQRVIYDMNILSRQRGVLSSAAVLQ